MLQTSTDIFWLVLSFVILWIGIFMGLGLYYAAMMMRDARKVTSSLREKLELVDQILKAIKDKVEKTANYLPPLIEGVSKLVEHFKEKKEEKGKRKK